MLFIIPELTSYARDARPPADSWKFTPANTAVVVVDMQISGCIRAPLLSAELGRYGFPKIQELLRYCHARKNSRDLPAYDQTQRFGRRSASLPISNATHDADNQWNNFEGRGSAEIYEPLKSTQHDTVVETFRVASYSSGEKDALQSDKNTTLKSRMAPSRTVLSQHSSTH